MLTCSFPSPRGVVSDTQEIVCGDLENVCQLNQLFKAGPTLSAFDRADRFMGQADLCTKLSLAKAHFLSLF